MENTRRVQKCLIFTNSIPFGAKNKTEILLLLMAAYVLFPVEVWF